MRKLTVIPVLVLGFIAINDAGCHAPKPRSPFTAENNPTTLAGRGAPDLEDGMRAAAWVFVDGYEGHYIEVEGHPHVEWIIDQPVCSTPTFSVEAYEPLLGKPTNFSCALKTISDGDGAGDIYYGIAAEDGTFEVGKEYSLLAPGDNFVIRDRTGGIIDEIAPLAPGRYLIAAAVENPEVKKVLAVTYFTVRDEG